MPGVLTYVDPRVDEEPGADELGVGHGQDLGPHRLRERQRARGLGDDVLVDDTAAARRQHVGPRQAAEVLGLQPKCSNGRRRLA